MVQTVSLCVSLFFGIIVTFKLLILPSAGWDILTNYNIFVLVEYMKSIAGHVSS